jgi:hypothetical protein
MSEWIGDLTAMADDGRGPGRPPRGGQNWSSENRIQPQGQGPYGTRLPPKLKGELGELDFLRKAMGMGMLVSKPWGDSYRYDFVVDCGGRLSRTQVRSTEYRSGLNGFAVHASIYEGKKAVPLTEKDIDVLVAFISARNIWYVLPVGAFSPRTALCFYPDGSTKGALFEEYREAWWVMSGRKY